MEKQPPIASPDNDPDPMQEMFGPGSGLFKTPEEDESAPEELIEVFEEYGNLMTGYRCVFKDVSNRSAQNTIIKTFNTQYPSIEWITNWYGPGEYLLIFMYKVKDTDSTDPRKKKTISHQVRISISEKSFPQYRKFQFEQNLRDAKDKRQKIQDAKIEQALDLKLEDINGVGVRATDPVAPTNALTQYVDPAQAGKKYVQDVIEAARMLGLTKQESSFDLGKILAALAPILPAVIDFLGKGAQRAQEQQQQFMTLLMTTMKGNNDQLLEIMKANQGDGAAMKAVNQFKEMLTGAIDIKTELAGMGKETVADKVFKLIEGLAGHVMPLLMMPRAQALTDPRAKIAQAYAAVNPDIQALNADPKEQSKLVRNLDDYYGWEQTNGMLVIMGWKRPDDCPCEPGKQWPPDDPRNDISGANANPGDVRVTDSVTRTDMDDIAEAMGE